MFIPLLIYSQNTEKYHSRLFSIIRDQVIHQNQFLPIFWIHFHFLIFSLKRKLFFGRKLLPFDRKLFLGRKLLFFDRKLLLFDRKWLV